MLKSVEFSLGHLDFFSMPGAPYLETDLKEAYLDRNVLLNSIISAKGYVVAIPGLRLMGPGIAELFSLVSYEIKKHQLEYTKIIRTLLEDYARQYNLHKLIFTVRETDSYADKWARVLGFKKEGFIEGFGSDGSNHHLYGRRM
jgi:hypothetical protein